MTPARAEEAQLRLPLFEFVVLMAMLFALTAFSIDSMLPALPQIASELVPAAPNKAQLIIGSFVLGMGLGTFITGPLSDAFGRRRVILWGAGLYSIGAALAYVAPSLELIVAARLLQGLGVAGPRIAAMALVRDLYAGREMARIISVMMMVFVLVPAVAPLMGAAIINQFGWRSIFMAFVLFAAVISIWFGLRQPETLPAARRRPMDMRLLAAAAKEIMTHRLVALVTLVMALAFATLFATIATVQQIFDITYHRAEDFPAWFAFIALVAGTGNLLNARLVMRLGMRLMVIGIFGAQIVVSTVMVVLFSSGWMPDAAAFWAFLFWVCSVFFTAGLTLGNLNALALEPMGHIAGTAASVVSALATIGSVLIAVPIGLAFDGTPLPLMMGVLLCCIASLPIMLILPKADR
jgi:DHA1 family bicyclomycin/chloramphenicol resistance-like MFS transporter